ncbi:MAG TPA: TIGR00282 family metallophosphoesterase [Clostridia bacterium]|nr:MAG: Calcineurin-like phosphoesterase [Firmicutes bacterium ADurb.Bin146]HOD93175.1 TIGR00282 family metallophosphoesterase [Clostridia bacterium]HQM38904.1 TIGR00282 family metallophosphoesterase [Clostridia bacterium]
MKILFIGDIYGKTGRVILKNSITKLKDEYSPDYIIANGENVDRGKGITPTLLQELLIIGVDVVTSGNHIYAKKEILPAMEEDIKLLRPLNYPKACPGKGYIILNKNNTSLCIINVTGRVYMEPCDDPFLSVESIIDEVKKEAKNILIDFHGEATSEKAAFAWYFDGRVSAVIGTHTHVQTADDRILPFGTAFITDAGMTGPYEGIIGASREAVIDKFLTGMPSYFTCQEGKGQLNAVFLELCEQTGKAIHIERINKVEKD